MDPDRSSRVAARRIVEEVLADHAARATALDGAKPVTIVERPDTPSWRAARRIVEETLAEHAARAVVPPATRLDVVVDLEEQDVEVVVDLDGQASATEPPTGQVPTADPSEVDAVGVVAPIERDETPAKAARRVVEGVLTEQEIEPDPPTDPHDAPMAFEVDPVPAALPEPPEPVTTGSAAAVEPSDAGVSPVSDEVEGEVVPVDEVRLRAAIPERLFAPEPESTDADATFDEPPAPDEPDVAPSVDGPPPPPRILESIPPVRSDPDAPVAIAARIVAGVLADRERAAQEAREAQEAQETREADVAEIEAEISGSEPPDQAADRAPDAESGTGPVAPEGSEAQPSGLPEGWAVVPSAAERGGPGSPSGVMTVDAEVDDLPVLDPVAPDPRVDELPAAETDEFWMEQEAVDPATEDEFGAWPDPIAPPRRTGRWLITTVLGAVLLALLLPLAIGALRDLVSFS